MKIKVKGLGECDSVEISNHLIDQYKKTRVLQRSSPEKYYQTFGFYLMEWIRKYKKIGYNSQKGIQALYNSNYTILLNELYQERVEKTFLEETGIKKIKGFIQKGYLSNPINPLINLIETSEERVMRN